MALIFDSWLLELAAVIVVFFAGFYIYMSLKFQYWKKKGVPYLEPSFPFGNMKDLALRRVNVADFFADMYWKLEGHKVGGMFQAHTPGLIIRDPELIKTICVRDFSHFHDRGLFFNKDADPLTGNLFFLEGKRWKDLRYKLTPTFTSGKMKMMHQTLVACGKQLKEYLAPMASRRETIEITDLMARYTTDVIATCAFGIDSNCLMNPRSEFRNMGRKIFNPDFLQTMRDLTSYLIPRVSELFKFSRNSREVSDFFLGIVKETMEYREKFKVTRNDFMQLLINIKNKKNINDPVDVGEKEEDNLMGEQKVKEKQNMYDVNGITTEELAAQAFVFFGAGFETSATTMSFCLYELALNQDIQDRLRDEVDSVITDHGGELTYEAIMKMEYLDMVVAETLRKYPPLPFLNRECTKDYHLPGTDAIIESGTPVVISVYALHHDPQYYPNPKVFDPDRFTEKAKSQRHHFVYLPFGEGPRICIGSRFGLMQAKVGLASILSSYHFKICKQKTVIPLVMDKTSAIMSAEGGIYLKITQRVKA